MAATPWLLLSKVGRQKIGLQKPERRRYWLAIAFGGLTAGICFFSGVALFGGDADNWFIKIANNYRGMMNANGFSAWKLHLILPCPR